MDILDIIISRRSIRRFEKREISDELLERVLEAGRWAPSGLNNQPWRFAVIRDSELREKISALTHYGKIVRAADVLVAVFMDSASSYHAVKDAQGIGACLQNMLLEAHSLGLGAVWLGEIIKSDEQIRHLLGLGSDLELMAVVALGYSAESPGPTKRKALKDLIVFRG
ncbi:MAG: nitroreductase [Nitrospiraceae bacterium]|nr:nitroreductase [Nitrospiraceae bacterium]